MKINEHKPPRVFNVGANKEICISHCADIHLKDDEQVTFIDKNGSEYDVAKKNWGYYATPSVNARLKNEGFKTALVRNSSDQIYIMVVDKDSMQEFENYCCKEKQEVLEWLDEREKK